jgi:hypothetical protein
MGPANQQDNTPVRIASSFKSLWNAIKKFMAKDSVRFVLDRIRDFLLLILFVAMVYLLVFLITKANLRLFQLFHHVNFESFAEQYVSDFFGSLTEINKLGAAVAHSTLSVDVSTLFENIAKLQEIGGSLGSDEAKEEVMLYVRFGKALRSRSATSKARIYFGTDRFTKKGLVDAALIDKFLENVGDPVDAIFEEATRVSKELASGSWSPAVLSATFAFQSHIHNLRLLGSYARDAGKLAGTRGKGGASTAALWFEGLGELVDDWWTENVPNEWSVFPQRFMDVLRWGLEEWLSFGKSIAGIPCAVSFLDEAEREKHCSKKLSEPFVAESDTGGDSFGAGDDEDEKEERETFVQFLMAIAEFFLSLAGVAQAVASLFINFPKDPVGSILHLLCVFLGVIMGLILIIIYAALTICGVGYVFAFTCGWIAAFVWPLIQTLFYLIMTVILSVLYVFLFLIDLLLGGALYRITSCEKLPSEWVDAPNYVYKNQFNRSIFYLGLVMRPCPRRFRPLMGGAVCVRSGPEMPDFCPQQQIYKVFSGRKLASMAGPAVFDKYRWHPHYSQRTPREKMKLVRKAYRGKREWNDKCASKLGEYDYVLKHVCTSPELVTTTDAPLLRALCNDAFCTGGRTASFCNGGGEDVRAADNADEATSLSNEVLQLVKKAAVFGMITFLTIIIITTILSMESVIVDDCCKYGGVRV